MLFDTGAEVTILSTNFLHRLFPGQEFPDRGRSVRSLGGNHIAVKGPVMLTIEICCQVLQHPVYSCDGATTPLLGYDVVSDASLVIDTEARQVWSKRTDQCGYAEQFTPPTTESPTATDPAAVRRSSTTASTPVNTTASDLSTVRQLPPTRPLLPRPPPVSQLLPCQQPPPQPPATSLLRHWRPFVCRRASPRGPLTTASPPLLHHRPPPTSVTLHVRQRPSL